MREYGEENFIVEVLEKAVCVVESTNGLVAKAVPLVFITTALVDPDESAPRLALPVPPAVIGKTFVEE